MIKEYEYVITSEIDLKKEEILSKTIFYSNSTNIIELSKVKDIKNSNNDEVFVFNGWTFSSSPSIQVFDHPVYDLWILKCY